MSTNTLTTADGLFKQVYGDLNDLTPDGRYFCKEIPNGKGTATGGIYRVPQVLSSEQGFTKAAPSSTAYALNSPIAGSIKYADVSPYNFSLRVAYATEAIRRSSEGKEVFTSLTKQQTKNAVKTAYNQQEQDIMWGQAGIGIVGTASSGTVCIISTASFAPGLWWGSEGMKLYVYDSTIAVLKGTCSVVSYDIEARTVTVDAFPAGYVAGDVLSTSPISDQMVGMNTMLTATSSTTLFNIPCSNNLWRPATAFNVGGALSFDKLFSAITRGFNRGLGDDISEFDVILSSRSWNNLNQDAAAIRKSDYSYKSNKFENGHEVLEMFTNAGTARIIAHKMMKEGEGFITPRASKCFEKLGADTTPMFGLDTDGRAAGTQYLRRMENAEGYESRIYWNTGIFSSYISQFVKLTGIVNND